MATSAESEEEVQTRNENVNADQQYESGYIGRQGLHREALSHIIAGTNSLRQGGDLGELLDGVVVTLLPR